MPNMFTLVLQIAVVLVVCRLVGNLFLKIQQPRLLDNSSISPSSKEIPRAQMVAGSTDCIQLSGRCWHPHLLAIEICFALSSAAKANPPRR